MRDILRLAIVFVCSDKRRMKSRQQWPNEPKKVCHGSIKLAWKCQSQSKQFRTVVGLKIEKHAPTYVQKWYAKSLWTLDYSMPIMSKHTLTRGMFTFAYYLFLALPLLLFLVYYCCFFFFFFKVKYRAIAHISTLFTYTRGRRTRFVQSQILSLLLPLSSRRRRRHTMTIMMMMMVMVLLLLIIMMIMIVATVKHCVNCFCFVHFLCLAFRTYCLRAAWFRWIGSAHSMCIMYTIQTQLHVCLFGL